MTVCRAAGTWVVRNGVRASAAASLTVLLSLGADRPALAQPYTADVPADARVLFESLAVVPTIRVRNVGWDDNVLYANEGQPKKQDFTATVSPAVEAWLRLPAVRIRGQGALDFVYFKDVSQYRSIDTADSVRAEFLLGRVIPYAAGYYDNARHRQNFEIDAPIRRVIAGWFTGADLLLTGKTSVGLTARHSTVDYEDRTYQGSDLQRFLNGSSAAEGARIRYAATPLTTVGASVEQYRNRFPLEPERDADGGRVAWFVELHPLAALSGRAEVGIISRRFLDGNAPTFTGRVVRTDLTYRLLGRTRFNLGLQRDLQYSFQSDRRDYLQAGIEVSVTHRLADAWDVRGSLARYALTYVLETPSGTGFATEEETVRSYAVDVGRYVAGARVGLQVSQQARTHSVDRNYERTRIVSSVTYGF